ncbi:MAG TPA: protein translocase subunit SecF [Nocardioides sp.]|nr:protein translocase subunit SecF [Nocardioides sp.]
MSDAPKRGLFSRLYHGETAFDFTGHRKQWFALSGVIILIGLVALGVKGLNYGIDFEGGTDWQVPAHGVTVTQARSAVGAVGVPNASVQSLSNKSGASEIRVRARVNPTDQAKVSDALAKLTHSSVNDVSVNSVGPTWGHDISRKAERALVAFFIALRFQWKMALAAIVAVIHDILVTVGVYAVFGFDVTPATIIAILTILGYSLYDTVVVFDKVDENTKGLAASGRMTYSDTVNLSMNQVLMRSLNTSLVAILPIASVLIVGDLFLGATTLKEFGLALFVGLITGAYSSIFIAAPILAILKEREPRYSTIRQRLESRGAAGGLITPKAAAEASAGGGGATRLAASSAVLVDDDDDMGDDMATASPVIRPGQAQRAPSPAARRPGPPPNRPRNAPRGRKKGKRR